MRAPGRRHRVPGRTIYHCLFLFRTRAPETAFLRHSDRFYFPPRSTPRSSWLLPFRTGKCTCVHVDTARNKRKPFCTFEETGAVSEVHGQITFSILRQACVRTSERNICTLNLFFSVGYILSRYMIILPTDKNYSNRIFFSLVPITRRIKGWKDVAGWGGAGLMVNAIWR